MIRDAGFEIEGNDAYHHEQQDAQHDAQGAATGASQFRIPGGGDELLKPEIARA